MIEDYNALIADYNGQALGEGLAITTTKRVTMPCQCTVVCGTDREGEQAALAYACDDEHDEVMNEVGERFAFGGRMERELGNGDRPQEEIAQEAMRAVFGEHGLPTS